MVENFHKLGDGDKFVRLHTLKALAESVKNGSLKREEPKGGISHRIYTTYSFSPYTPSKAAFMGYMSGVETLGIVDRDSVSGAKRIVYVLTSSFNLICNVCVIAYRTCISCVAA